MMNKKEIQILAERTAQKRPPAEDDLVILIEAPWHEPVLATMDEWLDDTAVGWQPEGGEEWAPHS